MTEIDIHKPPSQKGFVKSLYIEFCETNDRLGKEKIKSYIYYAIASLSVIVGIFGFALTPFLLSTLYFSDEMPITDIDWIIFSLFIALGVVTFILIAVPISLFSERCGERVKNAKGEKETLEIILPIINYP